MDAVRRISSLLLVVFCGVCVAAWAAWFNPMAFGWAPIPIRAVDFPGDPMVSSLGFGFGSLVVAYIVYPSRRRDEDDD